MEKDFSGKTISTTSGFDRHGQPSRSMEQTLLIWQMATQTSPQAEMNFPSGIPIRLYQGKQANPLYHTGIILWKRLGRQP